MPVSLIHSKPHTLMLFRMEKTKQKKNYQKD